jgi:YbbR domain-containing protein
VPRTSRAARHGWKLLSLLLAFLFWRGVLDERQRIAYLDVPIILERLDPSLTLVGERPTTVRVQVRGTEPVLRDLRASDIEVRVDLASFVEGTRRYRFRPSELRVPYGVEALEVYPDSISLTLERKVTALVAVDCPVMGEPAQGHRLVRVETSPTRVQVEGPESAVRSIDLVTAESVNVAGRKSSFTQDLEVHVDHPGVRVIGPLRVVGRVVIDEIVEERTFSAIPVAVRSATHVTKLKPSAVDVTARGPQSVISTLTAEDIEARVDLSGLQPNHEAYTLPVVVSFRSEPARARLEVKDVSSRTINVRIYDRTLPPEPEAKEASRAG